eukprot:54862_1
MATTKESNYLSNLAEKVEKKINKEKQIAINKYKSRKDIAVNDWITTTRSRAIKEQMTSDGFSYQRLFKLLIHFHVSELILSKAPNKMVLNAIMCIATMYSSSGIKSKVFTTQVDSTYRTIKSHFLFENALKGTIEARNKKIMKRLIFYDKVCPDIHTAAMVTVADCYNLSSVQMRFDETTILNWGFENIITDAGNDNEVILMPRVDTTTSNITYHTNNPASKSSDGNSYNPRTHGADNDVLPNVQMADQNIILQPFVTEAPVSSDPILCATNNDTEQIIYTAKGHVIDIKTIVTPKLQLKVYSPTGYHQQEYNELETGCTDLCGITTLIEAAASKQYESDVVFFLQTATAYITATPNDRDGASFKEAVSKIQPLMDEINDANSMHAKLAICKQYMEEEEINRIMINEGNHCFFRMNITDVLAVQTCDDESMVHQYFKDIKQMKWLINTSQMKETWCLGNWDEDTQDTVAELNDMILAQGMTPTFGIQIQNHFFHGILLKVGDLAVWWNDDTLRPTGWQVENHRPFALLADLILNYDDFDEQRLLGLGILSGPLNSLKCLILDDVAFIEDVAHVIGQLARFKRFEFELKLTETKHFNVELPDIAQKITDDLFTILSELTETERKDTDFHKRNLIKYLDELDVDASLDLDKVLIYRAHENMYFSSYGFMDEIISYRKEKQYEMYENWDINILSSFHLFHVIVDDVYDAHGQHLEEVQSNFKNYVSVIEGKQKILIDVLWSPEIIETTVTCESCKQFISDCYTD